MGRPYDHQYQTAGGSSHGTMQCAGCGKKITEGEYRVYKKTVAHDWVYVTHHRECSANDPAWARLDQERANRAIHQQALCAAADAFHAKWGVTDLSDYISTPGAQS